MLFDDIYHGAIHNMFLEECDLLYAMRTIDHPHLLRAIAAFERGEQCGLIMPLARGSLRSFCKAQDSSMYEFETIIPWLFTQLLGVAEGLVKLHNHRYDSRPPTCHGALTPDNILWFPAPESEPDAHSLGFLVIGGAGWGKHLSNDETGHRGAELRYLGRERPQSPVHDTWSLGLILFEFVIWLLRGSAEVQAFRSQTSHVSDSNDDGHRFEEWSRVLMTDERCLPDTPLAGLVQFIVRRLLVPDSGPSEVEGRATASQFHSWLSLVRSVVAASGAPYTAVQPNLPSPLGSD